MNLSSKNLSFSSFSQQGQLPQESSAVMAASARAERPVITAQLLRALQPNLDPAAAEAIARNLQAAANKFEINTPRRLAHFVAQLAQESGFQPIMENLNYSAENLMTLWPKVFTEQLARECQGNPEKIANAVYQNPTAGPRLGNVMPGDGFRFLGRGLIPLTGRNSYMKYSEIIERDIADAPELLLKSEVSALAAAAFWRETGCNSLADIGGIEVIEAITRKVAGGTHGLDKRRRYFQLAEQALGYRYEN
jgi:putative chitinase